MFLRKAVEDEEVRALKKLWMAAAMLGLVLALTLPALAATTEVRQKDSLSSRKTGEVKDTFTVTSTGNNSDQCATPLQFGNSGPQQNNQGVLQDASTSGSIREDGATFRFTPTLSAPCTPKVEQSSAAASSR